MTKKSDLSPIQIRAARIRKRAIIVLLINLALNPLTWFIFEVASPRLSLNFNPAEVVVQLSMVVAFLATAHIGRGYEMELRERTANDPDTSRTAANIQSAGLIVFWTIVSALSALVTLMVVGIPRAIFAF